VCNACSQVSKCTLVKQFYRADKAQKSYEYLLSEARSGFNITENEIKDLNNVMAPLIDQGQSIEQIIMSNPDTIMYSARSIYTYTRAGLLTFKNWDLPRVVKMKPRKAKSSSLKVDKKCRIDRTWEDYQNFRNWDELLDISPVEIDSVIGSRGGKTLLTILFTNCSFMLAFLRNRNDSQSVIDVFNYLDSLLGRQLFMELFPVILADNGSEFSNPAAIEFAPDGSRRTRLFYCDPMSPYQKPRVEQNHTFIRRILPKGSSFDSLSQHDIDIVMSHVNSCKRTALHGRSPFEAFSLLYGEHVISLFPYKRIDPKNIILRPSLLH
jgi:IS30 family transposase